MKFTMNYKLIVSALLGFISILVVLNIVGVVAKIYFSVDYDHKLILLLDLNEEKNIPSFFSAAQLGLVSTLCGMFMYQRRRNHGDYLPWFGLSFIFLFLSFDEFWVVHERLVAVTRQIFDASGFFYYAWIIPYGVLVLIFTLMYSRFLMYLPKPICAGFILSGLIFVAGAIGIEMLGANIAQPIVANGGEPAKNLTYCIYYTVEETLEMLGILLFINTLLTYFISELGAIKIKIK